MQKPDDMALVRELAMGNSETVVQSLVAQEITQAVFVNLPRKAASLPDAASRARHARIWRRR